MSSFAKRKYESLKIGRVVRMFLVLALSAILLTGCAGGELPGWLVTIQAFFAGVGYETVVGALLAVIFFFKPGFSIIEFFKKLLILVFPNAKIPDTFWVLFTQIVVGLVVFAVLVATNALNLTEYDFTLKSMIGLITFVWSVAQYPWQKLKDTSETRQV